MKPYFIVINNGSEVPFIVEFLPPLRTHLQVRLCDFFLLYKQDSKRGQGYFCEVSGEASSRNAFDFFGPLEVINPV